MESKCKADFDCAIADLPGFIDQLKGEAETALKNAEVILGLREGTVAVPKPQQVSTPVPAPVAASGKTRMAPRVAPVVRLSIHEGQDEDGLPG